MSMLAQSTEESNFVQDKIREITSHIAWHQDLTGVEAEAVLRDQPDMTYLLRQGEKADHFYLSYVQDGTNFKHLPFTIHRPSEKWFYRNVWPRFAASLQAFIPEIMHQDPAICYPLTPFNRM